MSPEIIGVICLVVMMVFMYSRMWVGLCMLFVGFWGLVAILGFDAALAALGTIPYRNVAHYPITVIPLFMLMAIIVTNTGVGADLFYAAHRCIGQLRGGLAMATVAASTIFAAIVATSMASLVTMGKAALPEMKKFKYNIRLAAGSICAGSTLGILIPPSMGFVLYGILTGESIGRLFIAGFLPGVLSALLYIATIFILCRFNPSLGPAGPKTTLKEKALSLQKIWPVVFLFFLVLGGIYLGIFTPTEAGAIGAFGAIVITLLNQRLKWKNFLTSVLETAQMTAMMILIIVGAFTFINLMTVSNLPFALSNFVAGLPFSKYGILVMILLVYIILGSVTDIMACLLLTIPIVYPIITSLGFDPIWYGVIMVRMMEVGSLTPPVGMNVFMLSGITGVPVGTIFRGIAPFLIADLCHITLLIVFPQISLFLPSMM